MEIVGFAAHNRGYRVNYFSRLKELQRGDIIKYFVDGKKYSYKVNEISVIYETEKNRKIEKNTDCAFKVF